MNSIKFISKASDNKEIAVKAIPISLQTLEQTQTLLEYDGRLPASQPIKHYDFIKTIQDIVSKEHDIVQKPIWVTNAAAKRIPILDPENIGIPQSWLFQRLVTRINIQGDHFSDEDTNMNIAIGFTDKGIQVAFGQNVRICSNQCIFGGRYMSTYGNNKIPYDKMLEVIREYTHSLPAIRKEDTSILNDFKGTFVYGTQIKELIGDMHLRAVKAAYFNDQKHISPMNIGQVSAFSKTIGLRSADLYNSDSQNVCLNLYDLYNDGTQLFKPDTSEITSLWEDVNNWGEYINNYKLILN